MNERIGTNGFAVVDCETTGLSASSDRMVEIAVILVDADGVPEGEWTHLINPGRPVDATFIHGLTDDDVALAPPFSALLSQVVDRLHGRAVVAHNARFDVAFLNAAFGRAHYPFDIPADACVCTMELSKIYLPPGRHSLVEATRRAGIPLHHHHRALDDAWACAQLLRHYLQAEASGTRYAESALTREGRPVLPASWLHAQNRAAGLAWPTALPIGTCD